jgi:hypothetical protein
VRRVRTLGLCLVAAFTVSAMAAVPALAKASKSEKEEQKIWPAFKYCPYQDHNSEAELCFAGVTSGGKTGGFFTLGGVTVPLSKPITLQGGLKENETTGELNIVPAANGGETLESPELKVPGGLGLLTPAIREDAQWPTSLTEAFKEAKKNKETALSVKIELAGGNALFELEGALNTTNLIFEEGPAFKLPLKVRMISPFLTKLGGGPCEIGNEGTPVWQYLTSEPTQDGSAGFLKIDHEGDLVVLERSRLGDTSWAVEPAAHASGCGSGEDEQYVDAAINNLLGLERGEHGVTVLAGHLYEAVRETVQEELEG